MTRQPPRTPKGLEAAGKRLFREVAGDLHPSLEFDAKDVQTLERAAVLADLVELLRADVRERGVVVEGSTGRMMTNPSVAKIGDLQMKIAQMLAKVQLEPAAKTGGLGVKQRNRLRRNELLARGGPGGA